MIEKKFFADRTLFVFSASKRSTIKKNTFDKATKKFKEYLKNIESKTGFKSFNVIDDYDYGGIYFENGVRRRRADLNSQFILFEKKK
jgi:hypothetical protein